VNEAAGCSLVPSHRGSTMIVRWSRRQRRRPPRWRAPRALLLLLLLLVALLAATPTLVVAQLSGPPTSTPDPPPAASPAPPAGEDGTSTGASPPGGGGGDGGATDAGPDPYAGMEGFPGSVSDVTGARYQDLVDDAARRSNETNGTTFAGANNPYLWLYGDKVVEEELNPRLICRGGCVDPEALGVLLVWCAAPVDYLFCNRTLAGPTETSILNMESGAIAAYMSLVRRVPKAGEECKTILRKWMCYEFFNRCNTDETEFFPVCQARSVTTLVPIRPRSRGERRSLRTFAGASLRPLLAFNLERHAAHHAFRLHF